LKLQTAVKLNTSLPKKELELLAEKNVLLKLFQYPLSLIAGNTL
jgi:hypothetical protein